jgi:O-antigen/teichoic acid export membrane protein
MPLKRVLSFAISQSAAQVLMLVSALLLARVTSPAIFGLYATFLAQAAMVAALLTLRFDAVTASSENQSEAITVALRFVKYVSVVTGLLLVFATSLLGGGATLLVLAVAAATAVANVSSSYLLHLRRPVLAAAPRMSLALLLFPVQFALLSSDVHEAAIVGHAACSWAAAGVGGVLCVWVTSAESVRRSRESKVPARPLFAVAAILNQVVNNLPIQLVNNLFGAAVAGYFAVANRVLGAPLMVLGNAVSTALTSEISGTRIDYKKWFRYAVVGAFAFVAVGILLSHPSVLAVLSEAWAPGWFVVAILVPVYAARLLAVPAVAEINAARDSTFLVAWEAVRMAGLLMLFIALSGLDEASWLFGFAAFWTLSYVILSARGLANARRRVRASGAI